MNDSTVVADWTTNSGLRAVVLMTGMGHHCGYVGVPIGHPLHGISYSQETEALAEIPGDEMIGKRGVISVFCAALGGPKQTPEMVFDVHGSITYSGGDKTYPIESDLWWFGYDCAHCDDAAAPGTYMSQYRHGGIFRDLDYCKAECESLAQQIVEKTIPAISHP